MNNKRVHIYLLQGKIMGTNKRQLREKAKRKEKKIRMQQKFLHEVSIWHKHVIQIPIIRQAEKYFHAKGDLFLP